MLLMKRRDVFTKEKRSWVMSRIRSTETKAEIRLRKDLWKHGLRYRKHCKELVGKPDIVFPKQKVAVFVDGVFWHGYNWLVLGKVPPAGYWRKKIRRNVERDKKTNRELRRLGWKVVRFWEHNVLKKTELCTKKILKVVQKANV